MPRYRHDSAIAVATAQGKSLETISAELNISTATVSRARRRLLKGLGDIDKDWLLLSLACILEYDCSTVRERLMVIDRMMPLMPDVSTEQHSIAVDALIKQVVAARDG